METNENGFNDNAKYTDIFQGWNDPGYQYKIAPPVPGPDHFWFWAPITKQFSIRICRTEQKYTDP